MSIPRPSGPRRLRLPLALGWPGLEGTCSLISTMCSWLQAAAVISLDILIGPPLDQGSSLTAVLLLFPYAACFCPASVAYPSYCPCPALPSSPHRRGRGLQRWPLRSISIRFRKTMRSSPSFYKRPRLGFHRSLIFFCLSFSLVTALRPRGVSPSTPLQADPSQFRKRDSSAGPPSQHVEVNSATTAEFAPLRANNSSSVHNSSSHDATNSSHLPSPTAPHSSPDNTPELKHPSNAVLDGSLNASKVDSDHEDNSSSFSTSPPSLPLASGQHNSSTVQSIAPNKTAPHSSPNNTPELKHPSNAVLYGSLNASKVDSDHEDNSSSLFTSPPSLPLASGEHNSSAVQSIAPNKTTPSSTPDALQHPTAVKLSDHPASETHDNHSSASVALNSSLSSNISAKGDSQLNSDRKSTDVPTQQTASVATPQASPESHDTSSLSSTVPTDANGKNSKQTGAENNNSAPATIGHSDGVQEANMSLVSGSLSTGNKSSNDNTRIDNSSKNLTTSDATIKTHDSHNHTFPTPAAVPFLKDDHDTNQPETASNQSATTSFSDNLSALNRSAPPAFKPLTSDQKSDGASVKSDKSFKNSSDGINNSSGQAAELNTTDATSISPGAQPGRAYNVSSHSEPSMNASALSPSSSADFGVNYTASPNVTAKPVADANGSYVSAGALNAFKPSAPAIGQAASDGKQNPSGLSRNTSSSHPGENYTIGVVPSNSSASYVDGALPNRRLSNSNDTAAALTDFVKTRTGANTSALSSGVDAALIASPPNASSFDPAGTAASPNQPADSGGGRNSSGAAGALLTNSVAKSDVAAAALAHLDQNRTGANMSVYPNEGDARLGNASLPTAAPASLSSATSAHFGNDSAGAHAFNITSNSTNGAFLNSTLASSDAAATALTDLDKTRTGPALDGDGNTNHSSSHNVSSLSSATSEHFGASTASNFTENHTGGAFLNQTFGNNETAAAALLGLQNAKNGGMASAPSSEAQNSSHNSSSSIFGLPKNASSLSSTTVAHFGNDSADGDAAYNLTRNHTDGPFINGALAPSHAFAGALTALNKTRSGLADSTPSGEGDSAFHKTLSNTGSAKNISSLLSSATSAHFGTNSTDGRAAFNLTGNSTGADFLNSTYANSEVAGAALTELNKNRTGVIASSFPSKGDETLYKNASHLGSSPNVSSLSSATSAHFGNDSAIGTTDFNLTQNLTAAFNVTRNSTNGGLPNTGLDAGVATALTGLNKTRTGVNGTIESSLAKLNESDLPGVSNSSLNSTLAAQLGKAAELNITGISPVTTLLPGSHTSVHNVSSSTEVPISRVNSTRPNNTEVTQGSLGLHHNATAISASSDTNRSAIAPPSPAPAFVPVSTLFTNPVTPQPAPTTPSPKTTADTTKYPKPEPPAPFPTTWPRYIVPSNAPTSAPENTTLISILFSNSLNWPWLVTNSNASSQVLVFMPALVSTALHVDASQVVTQSLQAYQPTSFNSQNEGSMLTVWLGYIPSQYVDELQAMLKAPQSAFYKQDNPIYDALGKTVDSSLPLTTFSSQAHAAQQAAAVSASSNESQSSGDQGQKMAVIASVTSCGAAILAIGLFLAARQSKQKLKSGGAPFPGSGAGRNLRPLQLSPSSRLQISAPMIGSLSHRAGHSHYYGQAAQARAGQQPSPGLQSFPSFPSLATGMSVMAEDGGHGPMVELPVHYEYGHAHTTSTDIQHGASSRARVDSRSSWWRVHSEEAMNDFEIHQHPDSLRVQTSASPSLLPSRGLARKISSRKSDGSFGMEPHQRPAHRRLQITRGADGLVSGIGRPVMKENSLFF